MGRRGQLGPERDLIREGVVASVKGVIGKITWRYYTAAAIYGYRVGPATPQRPTGEWRLRARVVAHDAFKLKQTPLLFVADYKAPNGQPHAWYWPIVEYDFTDGTLTARLAPPIERTIAGMKAMEI